MVQVIKRTKVNGEVFENRMSFSDNEWILIQKHYPYGGVSFHIEEEKVADKAGRVKGDDKPEMRGYNDLKDLAMGHYKKEEWDKALYYFQECSKHKTFGWLTGKINECTRNAKA